MSKNKNCAKWDMKWDLFIERGETSERLTEHLVSLNLCHSAETYRLSELETQMLIGVNVCVRVYFSIYPINTTYTLYSISNRV